MPRDRKDGQGNAPDQHQHLGVQARVAEQLSRLAEQRYRAIVPEGCKAGEAASLIREAVQAEIDAAEANAVEEYGSVIDSTIKSRRSRDQFARFKRETARSFFKDFCQRAEQDLPGYREAYETLKLYVLGETTAAEMAVTINAHLDLYPVRYQVSTKPWRGKVHLVAGRWRGDDGLVRAGVYDTRACVAVVFPGLPTMW